MMPEFLHGTGRRILSFTEMGRGAGLDEINFVKCSHDKCEMYIRHLSRPACQVGGRIYESGFRIEARASRESSTCKFMLRDGMRSPKQ